MASENFRCFLCSLVIPGVYSELARHFRNIHGLRTSGQCLQPLVCGQNGCEETFHSWSNFNYHVKRCEALLHHAVQHPLVIQNCDVPYRGEGHVQVAQQDVLPDFGEEDPPPHDIPKLMTREIANMLLHLRAHHQVSHWGSISCLS